MAAELMTEFTSQNTNLVVSSASKRSMARVRTRMPVVFVGHPFGHKFPKRKFRQIFKELPFSVQYGNTDIQTAHLLAIMKSNISKADFSMFDLSDWNPNVALELGLAEGLKRRALKPYYILLNTRRSKEVPSDIRGLQRLEYTSYDFKSEVGLGDQLIQILGKEYWVRKLWKLVEGEDKAEKKRITLLKILGHYRDHEKLTPDNLHSLTRGTHLRKEDRNDMLRLLLKLKLIKAVRNTNVYVLRKKLYKER